ncbi:MAG: hypothetical protein RL199_1237 [Pseudomonadota bacterium]|jgi:DNA-binding MarR family transcriptional regulator
MPTTADVPAASTALPLPPALGFMRSLWLLNHSLERLSSRMERHFGVTAQQRLMIRCIGTSPGLTSGQLSNMLRVDPGTVSAALKRLEAKGLVDRSKDKDDRRRVLLKLTARGRLLDQPMDGTVEHAVDSLLASRRTSDVVSTVSVIEQLAALLGNELSDERGD